MKKMVREDRSLKKLENFLEYGNDIEIGDELFKKLMFMYSVAIREIENKTSILKDEFKELYDYELINHIDTRIKEPESILRKMKKRQMNFTYKEMIENVNDIAGIRIVCPLKKDIFSIEKLIKKIPGVNLLKEKDYITYPKESGYSSYHMIVEVPVTLSKSVIYMKVEIQIRTLAMDFWANMEHRVKYKPNEKFETLNNKESKEWINCAKLINKMENKMMLLNS